MLSCVKETLFLRSFESKREVHFEADASGTVAVENPSSFPTSTKVDVRNGGSSSLQPLSLVELAARAGVELDPTVPIIRAYMDAVNASNSQENDLTDVTEPADAASAGDPAVVAVVSREEETSVVIVESLVNGSHDVPEVPEASAREIAGAVDRSFVEDDAETSKSLVVVAPEMDIDELERLHQQQIEELLARQRRERQLILAEFEAQERRKGKSRTEKSIAHEVRKRMFTIRVILEPII
jgi:hypothetical protein